MQTVLSLLFTAFRVLGIGVIGPIAPGTPGPKASERRRELRRKPKALVSSQ